MRQRLLFFVLFLTTTSASFAQIIGTDCFLQGRWLEVGINAMDGFGTCTSPAGYHAHGCCSLTPATTLAADMDASYDWGHDGWTVGTNPFVGPYTIPGYPQEGWSVQVGATEYRNGGWGGVCTGAFAIPGTHTGYSNVGGRAVSMWTGNIVGLNVRQETRVDTLASWAVITCVLKNTTGSAIANVWYERTCDPDNTTFWQGTPTTRNRIVHQNEDARHMVQVSANGESPAVPTATPPIPAYDTNNTYLGYVAKDCRARCGVINGLSPTNTPSTLWTNTPSVTTPITLGLLGTSNKTDQGIYIVFNIGTIPAFDSAIVSYAYIYNSREGIDSALPDPQLIVNGIPMPVVAAPTPSYDTVDFCQSGLVTVPINIINASDKDWSWSHWTWSPGLGLATTTGVDNILTLTGLPPIITYTITGSDSGTGMYSCNQKTFYLTIINCNGATANSPCVGDSLLFNAPGDSLGATYRWFGPYPSTAVFSTSQSTYKFPCSMLDAGVYSVAKTIGGVTDTATVDVVIHSLPVLAVSSSLANCAIVSGAVTLTVSPDTACSSYSWTGPNGFTSTEQFPTIIGFDSTGTGTYIVQATSYYGCKNTGYVNVYPGVVPNFSFDNTHLGCPNDTVSFANTTYNANVYSWNFGDGSTFVSGRDPMPHVYSAGHNVYTVTLTASNPHCTASKSLVVDLRHDVIANFSANDTICLGTTMNFNDLSTASKYGTPVTPLFSHFWDFGDGNTDATNGSVAHEYAFEGGYAVTLTVTDSFQCTHKVQKGVFVLQPHLRAVEDTTFCLVQPMPLENVISLIPVPPFTFQNFGYTYSWSPATGLNSSTVKVPTFTGVGDFTYTLTATLNHFGCTTTAVINLHSIIPAQLTNITANATIAYGGSIYLNAQGSLHYTWTPNDGSLNNNNINNPVATPTITTTYTVFSMDEYGCRDTAKVTVTVDSTQIETVPTGFTPNGDGLNDIFRLSGSKYQHLVEMRVFNRWGQLLFVTANREKGWDGTFNGVPQDLGTYYYTVIVARPGYGDNIVYKGEVTLIR